nr:ROK family protein [Nesterenkonia sp. PF2B19]
MFAGKRALLEAAGLEPDADAETLVALTEWEDEPGERARQAIDRAGWALGVALSGAVNLLDVDDIVLGGEFGPLADLLRPRIEQELRQRVLAARWSRFRVRETSIRLSPATTGGALRALRAWWTSRSAGCPRPPEGQPRPGVDWCAERQGLRRRGPAAQSRCMTSML